MWVFIATITLYSPSLFVGFIAIVFAIFIAVTFFRNTLDGIRIHIYATRCSLIYEYQIGIGKATVMYMEKAGERITQLYIAP